MSNDLYDEVNAAMNRAALDPERMKRIILDEKDGGAWHDLIARARAIDPSNRDKSDGEEFDFYRAQEPVSKMKVSYLSIEVPKTKPRYEKWMSDLDTFCAQNPEMDIMRELWNTKHSGDDIIPSKASLEFLLLVHDWRKYNYWADGVLKKKHQTLYQTWDNFLKSDWKEYIKENVPEGEPAADELMSLRKTWKAEIFRPNNCRFKTTYNEKYVGELELDSLPEGTSIDFIRFLIYDAAAPNKEEPVVEQPVPSEEPQQNYYAWLASQGVQLLKKRLPKNIGAYLHKGTKKEVGGEDRILSG